MAWDFSTDPEYQRKLDWARDFVRTQKDRPLAVWRRSFLGPSTRGRKRRCATCSSAAPSGMSSCEAHTLGSGDW